MTQEGEATAQALKQEGERKDLDVHRRQRDGKREAVPLFENAGDIRPRIVLLRPRLLRARTKERNGCLQREWSNGQFLLAAHMQRSAAGNEDLQARTGCQQVGDERGSLPEVLKIVEN